MEFMGELFDNIDKLHTTQLGAIRIRKNLSLDTDDVVAWCKERIVSDSAYIVRKGKNYYVFDETCVLTVNANSYTIITAHRKSK